MYNPEVLYLLAMLRHKEFLQQAEQARLIASVLETGSGNRSLGQKILAWVRARLLERKRIENPLKLPGISDQCCSATEI